MISKNDFVMLNWGNLVQHHSDVLIEYEHEQLLKVIENLDRVYEKIKEVAPPATIVPVSNVTPIKRD